MHSKPYNNYNTSVIVFFTTNKLVDLHGNYIHTWIIGYHRTTFLQGEKIWGLHHGCLKNLENNYYLQLAHPQKFTHKTNLLL